MPITMTTTPGGLSGNRSLIGFGTSVDGIVASNDVIDLTGGSGQNRNFAFLVPRAGVITTVSGYFSTTAAQALIGTTLSVTVQLYKSTGPTNVFQPIPGASAILGPFTGLLTVGTVGSGSAAGLNIPVSANDRLLLVFSSTATGIGLANTVPGYASAGVVIQ